MDNLKWSKKYEVLSISKLILRDLGFNVEQINSLTEENMQAIADTLAENLLHGAGVDFNEEVKFLVSYYVGEIVEKRGGATP
jgi:hypothetical protein